MVTAARKIAPLAALVLAALFACGQLIQAQKFGILATDFKLNIAHRLIDGHTLYASDWRHTGDYPYPPLWAMLVTPLLVFPTLVAHYLAGILCGLAIVAALWTVGLRDPYCYAVALCSGPVILVITISNPTAFVTLLVALAYRYGSAPAGAAVALKLYPWPILVWGFLTRGRRDFVKGVLSAVALILVPWALIGFDGVGRYVSVAHEITDQAAKDSGVLSPELRVVLTALALAGMWVRRHRPADSFAFASLAMLTASQVLWGFYLVAALVPLAIHRPRISPAWFVLLALWGLDYYGRLIAVFALLAWLGVGAPTIKLTQLRSLRSAQ